MSNSAEKIRAILDEIGSTGASPKTAQEIACILLEQEACPQPQGSRGPVLAAIDKPVFEDRIRQANETCQIHYYRPIYSCRRVIGHFIVFFKKAFRKIAKFLIEPIVEEQNRFNSAATNALNSVRNNDIVFEAQIAALYQAFLDDSRKIDLNEGLVKDQEEKLSSLSEKLRCVLDMVQEQRKGSEQLQEQVESYREALCELQNEIGLLGDQRRERDEVYHDFDYFGFEDHFRGPRAQIKEAQRTYVPYFKGCGRVLDLGCGRGEFLELLKEAQIGAVGVEIYEPFVEYCRMRGQEIVQEDAVGYLKRQDTASCDGIFSAQMVEHISTERLIALCRESYRVLEPGRALIIETPNPACLSTHMNSFYMDPTHLRLVHPKTLGFFLKETGFSDVRILYTEQSKEGYRLPLLDAGSEDLEGFNAGLERLSDIIFGSQDYAAIAVK